jgi:murein L,D-transpeptidase YcbB/YkuD
MAKPWRIAGCLDVLRGQVDALSPNRSRVSDGTIGDPSHSSRTSDHNPDRKGVVKALDITHDPDHGIDSHKLALALVASKDPRIKYIIDNRKICPGRDGPDPWQWRPYAGRNPHDHHVHISVGDGADDRSPWQFKLKIPPGPAKEPPGPIVLSMRLGDEGPDVLLLQQALVVDGITELKPDGRFGIRTQTAVKKFQRREGLLADGIVGFYTRRALGI